MRGALAIAVCVIAACGGDDATSGGSVTFSDEATSNQKFHGTMPLEETIAGHLPNNRAAPLGQLVFNVGTVNDAAWIDIRFYEPAIPDTFTIVDKQFTEVAAGEATLEYDEYGADRTWTATAGTFTITRGEPPIVSFEVSGAMMQLASYTMAQGSFTIALTATATEYGVND